MRILPIAIFVACAVWLTSCRHANPTNWNWECVVDMNAGREYYDAQRVGYYLNQP